MDNFDESRFGIMPKTMSKEYYHFSEALLDLEDFTDIAVNTATNINGYIGVSSVTSAITTIIDTGETRTTVFIFLEKDRIYPS